ncbi:MAG: hydrogenase maturation protease [Gammaproteobacteria bacterium]|jgi:hydrogenase maturation protease|nr:hydrogenase maturation protease [Gammaproteobacteria bacterium]MBT3488830.1 hydrogenase maturation protease [Gammaproteobacteria bacterium]MBT3718797.1 hydrogenase maturation protease [Gammaproteobacteria bacterium]MBT3845889.1 hydrogenase maturation protease [Gammaproteobacteria bacterium]MBT3894262.1 hydrogenase maturation protease [Gammaproteobacteria bacterium]
MKRAVIGVGSPFGKDQFGWRVADELQSSGQVTGVEYLKLDRPGISLLDEMKRYQQVVLVDALLLDEADKGVLVLDRHALIQQAQQGLSSHALGVGEVIALGSALGDLPEQLNLVGISATSVPFPIPYESVRQAVHEIVNLLNQGTSIC